MKIRKLHFLLFFLTICVGMAVPRMSQAACTSFPAGGSCASISGGCAGNSCASGTPLGLYNTPNGGGGGAAAACAARCAGQNYTLTMTTNSCSSYGADCNNRGYCCSCWNNPPPPPPQRINYDFWYCNPTTKAIGYQGWTCNYGSCNEQDYKSRCQNAAPPSPPVKIRNCYTSREEAENDPACNTMTNTCVANDENSIETLYPGKTFRGYQVRVSGDCSAGEIRENLIGACFYCKTATPCTVGDPSSASPATHNGLRVRVEGTNDDCDTANGEIKQAVTGGNGACFVCQTSPPLYYCNPSTFTGDLSSLETAYAPNESVCDSSRTSTTHRPCKSTRNEAAALNQNCNICCDISDWTVKTRAAIAIGNASGCVLGGTNPAATARRNALEAYCQQPADPWWQARGGIVYGHEGIVSYIPVRDSTYPTSQRCTPPACSPYLIARGCNSVWNADVGTTIGGYNYHDSASYPLSYSNNGFAIDVQQRNASNALYQPTHHPKTNRREVNTSSNSTFYGPKEDYDFFINLIPSDRFVTLNGDLSNITSCNPACIFNGDLLIPNGTDINLTTGKYTIFVTGNLNIGSSVTTTPYPTTYNDNPNSTVSIRVANGAYLGFIVQKDINIRPQVGYRNRAAYNSTPQFGTPLGNCAGGGPRYVGNIQGVFIADGKIIVERNLTSNVDSAVDPNCVGGRYPDKKFVGEGTFVGWNGVDLQRSFSDGCTTQSWNNTTPTETFNYRPDFLKNSPEWLWRSVRLRQETV